jgi:hypothetical protein
MSCPAAGGGNPSRTRRVPSGTQGTHSVSPLLKIEESQHSFFLAREGFYRREGCSCGLVRLLTQLSG